MKWSIDRKTTIGLGAVLGMLLGVGIGSYLSLLKFNDTTRQVAHTQNVEAEIEDLLSQLKDAETGQRGYLLTGEIDYLQPYNVALAEIDHDFEALRKLTIDNPRQQQRLSILQSLITSKLEELEHTISLRRMQGYAAALEVVKTNQGKQLMDQIRSLMEAMRAEELQLLEQRTQSSQESVTRTLLLIILGSSLSTSTFIAAIALLNHDTNKRRQTEERLKDSETKFRQLAENIQEFFWISNAALTELFYISPAYEQIWGRSCESLYADPTSFMEAIHPEDLEMLVVPLLRGSEKYDVEYRVIQPNGALRWVREQGFPVHNNAGEIYRWAGTTQDITDRKLAEEQIKAALQEKEILLAEVHHRVKNNLQIVNSLLRLQANHIQDPEALEAFNQSQNRIKTMALIHEKLYRSHNFAQVDFAQYLNSLVTDLFKTYKASSQRISLSIRASETFLNLDTSIPCGLIVNELITNTLQHAFVDRSQGEVTITLDSDDSQHILTVTDNGVGLPEEVDFSSTNSLGLRLVRMLTKQVQGNVAIDRDNGTTFQITFPTQNS